MNNKKVAIMQPYIFPYLGYFQLINAVDTFVFYDDVNFIKKGWVNRNKILVNGQEKLITIPCLKVSQNKLIQEIEIDYNKEYKKLLTTIEQAYKKAPFYSQVFPIIFEILESKEKYLVDKSISSLKIISNYLNISDTKFLSSSEYFYSSFGMDKAERLINITKALKSTHYINPEGGKDLYSKDYFEKQEIKLDFIKTKLPTYKQFGNEFISGLSIIDIMMFNDIDTINIMLNQYNLE